MKTEMVFSIPVGKDEWLEFMPCEVRANEMRLPGARVRFNSGRSSRYVCTVALGELRRVVEALERLARE